MDWVIVEVVIGLSFLFFVISIVSSAVNEAIAGVFKLRARTLERGVVNLITGRSQRLHKALSDPAMQQAAPQSLGSDVAKGALPPSDADPHATPAEQSAATTGGLLRDIFNNSLIAGYRQGDDVDLESRKVKLPSYLASRTFRNVLFSATGLLTATAPTDPADDPLRADDVAREVEEAIRRIPSEHLRQSLNTIWISVDKNVAEFRAAVERSFDRAMERVGGWYKRRAQLFLFLIGLVIAIAINADTIRTADHLWQDDGVREGLVAQLGTQQPDTSADEVLDRLEELGFPIGWGGANNPDGGWEITAAVIGWLITAIAVSLGSPFWFDVLGKFSNLRAAGKKPVSVLDEEDAQPAVGGLQRPIR